MHGKIGAAEASYPMQLKLQPTQKDPSRGFNHVGVEESLAQTPLGGTL